VKSVRSTARAILPAALVALAAGCADPAATPGSSSPATIVPATDWAQWAHTADHRGRVEAEGQLPLRILADLVVDPFTSLEKAESRGSLLTHFQVPLVVAGTEVYMAFKSGTYVPCNPPGSRTPSPCGSEAWDRQVWNQKLLRWEDGRLVEKWSFASDWKPVPDAGALGRWEPVFHAALSGDFAYVPGFAGSVHKVRRGDGTVARRIDPFGASDPSIFVTGPLTVDPAGNVYYNALQLDLAAASPWDADMRGAWLVRIAPDDSVATASFASLVPGAPGASEPCTLAFAAAELPWPPSATARPPTAPCGGQRAGINVAPAVAPDGTIYTVSRAHKNGRYGYLVAVNPDLSPRWAASLRGRLSDGCGSALMPPTGAPGGCRAGARPGVDPATNEPPAGIVNDLSSSSPTVAPDSSVLYGAYSRYNRSRGHLFKFGAGGDFVASYDFGWDSTPAIYPHGGTYSVVIKDNHYPLGSYCSDPVHCPPGPVGPYDITQLSADLVPEWKSTVGDEWCINAPAIDAGGRVYANAEDGMLYVIDQGGSSRRSLFLLDALGAAYTPVSLGSDGRIYTQNNGHLLVVGE
jgi:hypothetical protein